MRLHVLGACGTFMGGVAALAQALGHEVEGSDAQVYPPMSTQLEALGIRLHEGYRAEHLRPDPDRVIVGNALSRGNPAVEYLLDRGLDYRSGPQWLQETVLRGRWVLAVAGTHGKTTTASMLAWILEQAGLEPGFLIGGLPRDFGVSARLGGGSFFVIEADEYDTAFFDKRSKFLHYHPRTLVLNNLEFDHADIFDDLAAIQRQFGHLLRTVPGSGRVLSNAQEPALRQVLEAGCWTPVEDFSGGGAPQGWGLAEASPDGSAFTVTLDGAPQGRVAWVLRGPHNMSNALAAIGAARHAGVKPAQAIAALSTFKGVRRRLETLAQVGGITLYDDFAHHPTAIASTLAGLRAGASGRVLAVVEPRSNSMRLGVHRAGLAPALADADLAFVLRPPGLSWDLAAALAPLGERLRLFDDIDVLRADVLAELRAGDSAVLMSNGAFAGLGAALAKALDEQYS